MNGADMTHVDPEEATAAAVDLVACVELLASRWQAHRSAIQGYHGCWAYDEPGQEFDKVYIGGEGTGVSAHDTIEACDLLLDVTSSTGTDVGIAAMTTQAQDDAIAERFDALR